MREHGTTSAYYIIRVMAAMFVVVYLLLFIVNVMTTSRVKRFTYDSHACISIAYNPDLIYLPRYFCKEDRLVYFNFLFSFLFRHLSSLSLLLEVGLVGSRPPMEWRPVLSFTSLYIPHVPLPSLEFIVMVPYHSLHLPFGYIFSYCVCQVMYVPIACDMGPSLTFLPT